MRQDDANHEDEDLQHDTDKNPCEHIPERATTARFDSQTATDEGRSVVVSAVVSADAPRLLHVRSEDAPVDQSTRESKQFIIVETSAVQ